MDEFHFTVRETIIGFFICMFALWLMGVLVETFA